MNNLGFIEKLLDGVEVEWLPFSEVGEFLRGKRFVKADMMSEGVPCIHYGEMYTHFGVWADQTKSFLDEDLASKLRVANTGDVIIVAAGETIEDIGNGTAWLGVDDVVFHDACFSFKSTLDPKYVSYYLRTTLFKDQIKKSVSSGKISSINAKGLGKAEIPIPCPDNPKKSLEIQAEIVRILDAFTAMTAELTAELNLRRQQYNYYRDQLLSFEDGEVEWKTLGDVCVIGDGNHSSKYPRSDEMVEKGVPFIRGTNMVNGTISSLDMKFITPEKHQELKKGHLKAYDVLMANRGEIGKIAQVPKNFSGANLNSQLAWLRAKQDLLLPRFLFYVLNTSHVQSTISGEGGALQQLTIKNIKLIRIPVPTIEKQSGIVAILDKFDALTSSITEGLPREIELRQKQYEYYRDLLLSFPKPGAEVAA